MENVESERAMKRVKKQGVEKQRRDKIKKSLDQLTLLIPEARKLLSQGQRLKQTKILQLTVDYIRSSGHIHGNQETDSFRPWHSRIIHDNAPCQHYCLCSSHMKPGCFQQCIGETGPNQRLSHGSQNEHCSSSLESLPSVQSMYRYSGILSPQESTFEVNDIFSGPLRPESLLGSCREWRGKSNMASCGSDFLSPSAGGQHGDEVAMEIETASTPPLQALQSLCSSINLDDFTGQATGDDLSTENYSNCAKYSQFELVSMAQGTMSHRVIPEILQPIAAVSTPYLVSAGTQDLWRPWDFEREI